MMRRETKGEGRGGKGLGRVKAHERRSCCCRPRYAVDAKPMGRDSKSVVIGQRMILSRDKVDERSHRVL